MRWTPEHVRTFVIGGACLLIGLTAPAGASQLRATFADNADKVDGFHAVGAGASVTQRKGKLVATSRTTGRLPDNIIAKAPNAARLGGFTHTQLRSFPLLVQGGRLINGASVDSGGAVHLPGGGQAVWSFIVPPDYHAGDRIQVDAVFETVGSGSCSATFSLFGESGPGPGSVVDLTNHWQFAPGESSSDVAFPAGSGLIETKKTVSWVSASTKPGQFIMLTIGRANPNGCSDVAIRGLLVRY
jgi:hypothetical protein